MHFLFREEREKWMWKSEKHCWFGTGAAADDEVLQLIEDYSGRTMSG